MTPGALLWLSAVFGATAHLAELGSEADVSNETHRESRQVFTTTGEECRFPFRQGGRIHHRCITVSLSSPWCSLTHNFDRDRRMGFCALGRNQSDVLVHSSRGVTDPCGVNPCQNGGVCAPDRPECSCPEGFSGQWCQQKKCYETVHLRYYDTGESWGRIHLRNVEQCTCQAGQIQCDRVPYTRCRTNPCQNAGTCRLITSTGKEACYCRYGFGGPRCSLEPEAGCYRGRGTAYRGVAGTTLSGARCLPWNSDLLFDELHVGTVAAWAPAGLGHHAFCRNPDGDKQPWCYTVNDGAISWEYCDVPSCRMPLSRRTISSNQIMPVVKENDSSKPARRPVCGRKHKKRLSFPMPRILGGTPALPGTHPWMAAIYIGQSDFCAGSLVSSCWVVSAAHCFFRNPLKSQIRVVLGQHRFNVSSPNTRTFEVETYVFPKQFSVFNPTLHDIVLIKLKKREGRCARRTPYISPICLPEKNTLFPNGYCCAISGWGHKYEKEGVYSTLQEGFLRLVSDHYCKRPDVYGNHVTSDMLCAGLSTCVDACQGDSGGPLACAKDDVSFLYGIISWGEGCGRLRKPGVYTKVVKYIDWIHSVIRPKSRKHIIGTLT
ncbi:unnamed protein product [Menidia menidia]|uniref:trypsin n=1 Tax=Menidia menidia TaxID=238744 RepID=A0A8S4BDE5_9TELE|nr:unnamed protein product [Menidia menidia]